MSEGTINSLSSSMPASVEEAGGAPGRVRMLVVEGDPSTLENLATVLAKRGFDVESFHDHPALHQTRVGGGALPAAPAFRRPSPPPMERFTCGKLQIDLGQRRVWWNDVEVSLTAGEFRIVVLLASHADQCVDYRTVYDYLHYKGFQSREGLLGERAEAAAPLDA